MRVIRETELREIGSAHAKRKREMHMRKQAAAEQVMQEAEALAPDNCWEQLTYFFRHYRIPASQGGARSVSVATETKYVSTERLLLQSLAQENIRVLNLSELSRKHLLIVART